MNELSLQLYMRIAQVAGKKVVLQVNKCLLINGLGISLKIKCSNCVSPSMWVIGPFLLIEEIKNRYLNWQRER